MTPDEKADTAIKTIMIRTIHLLFFIFASKTIPAGEGILCEFLEIHPSRVASPRPSKTQGINSPTVGWGITVSCNT